MTHVCSVYSPLCLIRGTRAVMAPLHGRANPSRCGSGQWGPSEPPMHANVLCSSFRPTEGPQAGRSRRRRPRYTTFFHHTYTHTTTSINKHTHTRTQLRKNMYKTAQFWRRPTRPPTPPSMDERAKFDTRSRPIPPYFVALWDADLTLLLI
jgi:hypothetical protein